MRFAALILTAALLFTAMLCVSPVASVAGMVRCDHFTSTTWVNPKNQKTGNTWTVAITDDPKMTCSQATSWAEKLNKTPAPSGFTPAEVSGGPAGYHCFMTPDGSGHIWAGSCRKDDSSGNTLSSIDWGPAL